MVVDFKRNLEINCKIPHMDLLRGETTFPQNIGKANVRAMRVTVRGPEVATGASITVN